MELGRELAAISKSRSEICFATDAKYHQLLVVNRWDSLPILQTYAPSVKNAAKAIRVARDSQLSSRLLALDPKRKVS
jgi:hypothetical protein